MKVNTKMQNLADQSTTLQPVNEKLNQGDRLYDALRYGDEKSFKEILEEMKLHLGENLPDELLKYSKNKNRRYTFLQCAIVWGRGHFWAVSSLIDAGVDPNETITCIPPLIEAALRGNVKIVEKLASHPNIKLDVVDFEGSKQTALHIIATKLNDATSAEEKSRFVGCLNSLVLQVKRHGSANCPWIDNQDIFGNTALHYAAISGVEDAVVQLLRIGCKLGIRNNLGKIRAIEQIKPSTLELYLDSCIKVETKKVDSLKEFSITFNYSLLAPPTPPSSQPAQQTSDTGIISSNHNDAIELVNLLPTPAPPSSSPQPVQQSSDTKILCSNRNDKAEPNNPSKKKDDKIYPECETLWHLSRSPEHQYLLKHPLIKSFLMLKWRLIRKFYYFNFVVYILFMGFLTAYILLLHSGYDEPEAAWRKVTALATLWYLLVCSGIVVLVRELFQLIIAPIRYFRTLDNYIELAMIGCTIAVMVHSDDPGPYRHVSAFAVLLAWAEGFFLFGRHPKRTIDIAMFFTFIDTLGTLLISYLSLLIGFALSFFLVFCEASNPATNKPKNSTAPECHWNETTIYDFPVSLLNVVVMMTGELDYGSLPFEAFPIASRIIFLSFLLLITIVLFNLLNGLAVSDTQDIRSKAKILGYASQVELISYLESIFLGDPFHFLVDWQLCDFVRNNCRSLCFKFLHCFAPKVLIFNCLPDKIIVYSSRHKKSYLTCMKCYAKSLRIPQCELCRDLADFKLEIDTLENDCRRIQEINNQRNKPTEQRSLEEILDKIEQLRTAIIDLQSERS